MKRMLCALMAALAAAFAEGRMVSVVSFDRATGAVSVTVGAGEQKLLYAVWDACDKGMTNVTVWSQTKYVQTVSASEEETTASWTLPEDWRADDGALRFFLADKADRPYDTTLTYLKSTGQWVDTEIVPDGRTTTLVTFTQTTSDMALFGVAARYYFFSNGTLFHGFFGSSGSKASLPLHNNGIHTLEFGPRGGYYDGIYDDAAIFGCATNSTDLTMPLFGRRNADGSIGKTGTCAIYSATIITNGVVARDFIPCSWEGVGYLYDRVTGRLFGKAGGSGSFSCGPVGAPEPGEPESWSEATLSAPTITVSKIDFGASQAELELAGVTSEGLIFAVHDSEDKGTDVSVWRDSTFITKVAGDTTTLTCTIPLAWWTDGGVVRFVWASAADHPYDRELVYLRSTGTQWISPSLIPDETTSIDVDCLMSSGNVCAFGLAEWFYFFTVDGNTQYFYGFCGKMGNNSVAGTKPGVRRRLHLGPDGASVDGKSFVGPFTDVTPTCKGRSIALFARRTASASGANAAQIEKNGECTIYSVKIERGGLPMRDLVPCVSNNVAYLYDRVRRVFLANLGTDAFVCGDDANPPIPQGGALFVSDAKNLQREDAVWDAGGGDAKFSTAANWQGDELPDLASGMQVAQFPVGTQATVDSSAALAGLVFSTPDSFTLGSTDSGSLALGGQGIRFELPSSSHPSPLFRYISTPLAVTADQTWNLSTETTQRLNLTAPVSGDAERTLTIEGKGVFAEYATNTFAGNVVFKGGQLKIFSKRQPFGIEQNGSSVTIDQENNVTLELFGATIDKTINITSYGKLINVNGASNYGPTRFTRPLNVMHSPQTFQFDYNVEILGGGTFQPQVTLGGIGKSVVISNAPITAVNGLVIAGTGRDIHLSAPSNSLKSIIFNNNVNDKNNILHLEAYNAAWWSTTLNIAPSLEVRNGCSVDLHGFYQTFGATSLDSGCRITGNEGSVFRVLPNNETWKGAVEGAVTLSKGSAGSLMLRSMNTSTGGLLIDRGTLSITNNACWTGTNVTLTTVNAGSGETKVRLRLFSSDAFATPRKTIVTIENDEKIQLKEGVAQTVKDLYLGTHLSASGTWGSSTSSAMHKDDVHFAGTGVLNVIGHGMMIIIR